MSAHPGCPREPELLVALRGAWPASGEEELRAHAASCESCRDLVQVVTALLDETQVQASEAPLPGSGLVWWKLQMRLRHDAARRTRRTLLLVQAASLAVAGALGAFMFQLFVPNWQAWIAGAVPAVRGFAPGLLALVVCLALAGAPVAAYLARRKSG